VTKHPRGNGQSIPDFFSQNGRNIPGFGGKFLQFKMLIIKIRTSIFCEGVEYIVDASSGDGLSLYPFFYIPSKIDRFFVWNNVDFFRLNLTFFRFLFMYVLTLFILPASLFVLLGKNSKIHIKLF
jgi:hypothetical protein